MTEKYDAPMAQHYDPLLGVVVENFRIVKRLGAGGMGQTHVAQHVTLENLRIVIKTMLREHVGKTDLHDRFVAEARALSRLNHPNIVKIANLGTLPTGEPFFTMPFVEGRALDELLRGAAKLGPHHVLQLAAQIGSALHHIHEHHIVHRDLKPGNVLITRERKIDKANVIDFGISKDTDASTANRGTPRTHTGAAIGTPQYMPCEAYLDAATVGPAADVFSLAVMVVEMLTGQLPWGAHPAVVMYNVQNNNPPVLGAEVPRAWIPILRAALAPDPSMRPQSARAFIIALANSLAPLPPIWKSGAEIMKDVAPDITMDATPQEETIRAANNTPLTSIPVYPSLGSSAGSDRAFSSGPASAPPPPSSPAPSMPATVNARPESPGSSSAPPSGSHVLPLAPDRPAASTRGRGALLGLLGLATVVVVAGAIMIVARIHRGRADSASQPSAMIRDASSAVSAAPLDAAAITRSSDASTIASAVPSATATNEGSSSPVAPAASQSQNPISNAPSLATHPTTVQQHSHATPNATSTPVSSRPVKRETTSAAQSSNPADSHHGAPNTNATSSAPAQHTGSAVYDPDAIKD